jgi:tryptophan halogenase
VTGGERSIRSVVVAGGGIVGWSAAAALKRKLPYLQVTLLASPPPPDALTERIGSTLPSILGFHADLGLGDEDAVVRARSGFRLGTRFTGWNASLPDYVHAYGPHGQPFGTTSFHHQWVRLAQNGGAEPFDAHSPAAALGRAGRFAGGDEADFEHGLQLDLPRYGGMIRAFARHVGVAERPGSVTAATLREDGFVAAVKLDDGTDLAADLFVDCTGPAATIRSALDDRFDSWSEWLPCDRILLAEATPAPEPPLLDEAEAVAAGWRWRSPSLMRISHGLVYASAHLADEDALRLLGHEASTVRLRQGRRPEPWLRNCVVVGDSAVGIEPLEWTNLHLAHSAIDRIVAMMPDRDCAPVELAEYNRQCEAEADRVRDFLALHYLASDRPEPFWRAAAAAQPPASLAHTLALFRERGRLPVYEEETFSRDSWLAVLLGQGVMPRRVDPLTGSLPAGDARAAMARMREAIAAAVAAAPSHATHLSNLMRQTAR